MRTLLALAGFFLILVTPTSCQAQSRENVEVWARNEVVLFCDTKAQADRYIELRNSNHDGETAFNKVNAENDPSACLIGRLIFIQGKVLERRQGADVEYQVVSILALAIPTPRGIQSIQPVRFYAVHAESVNKI